MPRFPLLVLLIAASLAGWIGAPSPASAEIMKYMRTCQNRICPYFRASITVPDNWVEDKQASRELDAQMLLPKGQTFEKAPAKIYVAIRFNPKKQPLSDFIPDAYKQLKSSAKDAKITDLPALARSGGKPDYVRYNFEAPSLPEQGYETQAVTTDDDKDGNNFIVTIVLSANSREAFKAAEPVFLSLLSGY